MLWLLAITTELMGKGFGDDDDVDDDGDIDDSSPAEAADGVVC